MSFLNYDGIQLSLVQTRRYLQEPIAVGQDGAGFRHVLTVLATVHLRTIGIPGGVAGAGPAPLQNAGLPKADSGLQAYLAVRDRLMRYRRPFQFVVATRVIADLPGPFPADVELGPKPLACNLVQFNADGSLLVEYTIQWAAPNPCKDRNGVMAVLAHAWSSEDDLDEQYFLTRTYTGTVHFDPRVVGAAGGPLAINPDRIRGLLLPPRTLGCYRRIVARLSEDGYSMAYRCTDRQPQAFCNSFEVVRVEATQKVRNAAPPIWEQLAANARLAALADKFKAALGNLGGAAAEAMRSRGRGSFFGDVAGVAGAALGVADTGLAAAAAVYAGIPTATHTFAATAYGNAASRYKELTRVARVVVLFRLMRGTLLGQFGLAPYGGYYEQEDSADPKASTVRMEVVTRPVEMAPSTPARQGLFDRALDLIQRRPAAANAAAQMAQFPNAWEQGDNRMLAVLNPADPTITQLQEVVAAGGQPIPDAVRQLAYGGTIQGSPADWGWYSTAFAPDLLSPHDAEKRQTGAAAPVTLLLPPDRGVTNALLNDAKLVANSLIQALQDPCAYKESASFLFDAPLKELP